MSSSNPTRKKSIDSADFQKWGGRERGAGGGVYSHLIIYSRLQQT